MFCSQCGSDIKENVRFCPNCGQALDTVSEGIPSLNRPFQDSREIPDRQQIQQQVQQQTQQPAQPPVMQPMNKSPKKRRFPKKFVVVLSVFLVIVLLVQQLVSPFLFQRITFNKFSPLMIKTMKPASDKEDIKPVTEAETKRVRSYAKTIARAYSWQLTGREKKIFQISGKYLKNAPSMKDLGAVEYGAAAGQAFRNGETAGLSDASGTIRASTAGRTGLAAATGIAGMADEIGTVGKALNLDRNAPAPSVMTVASTTNTNSSREYSREQIASDIAGLATILKSAGYGKLATALLALAAESSPVDPLILNELAGSLRDRGLKEDAYKLLNIAWRMDPSSPSILTNLGNVCLDMGEKDQAGTWFDMALDLDQDFGLAHEGLMVCYMMDKRYEVAMRHMIKASKTVFTSAMTKTYDYLKNRKDYEDIRDKVLDGFSMADIAGTYKRTRENALEDVDTPAKQLKIPKFPVYASAEKFIQGVGGLNSYAMSILNPAMESLKSVGEIAKQADELIKSFQSGGLSGVMGAADKLGLLKGGQSGEEEQEGTLQLKVSYEREQFTFSLLNDYVDMKSRKPLERMNEMLGSSNDPLLQASERGTREFEARGESEDAWLGAMDQNWGNSMTFSDDTVNANKANINQHIDMLYRAVLPAYNELKPVLEEYWLYTGGILKYCGDPTVFKTMDLQRKSTVYGNLATFAIIAEIEAINVPMVYTMFAINGETPKKEEAPEPEKLEEPQDEEPGDVALTYSLELWIIEAEWSNGELEVEATALLSGGAKMDFNQGTLTLAGGVGIATPDELPVGGKLQAQYYVCINKNMEVLDHGVTTKREYSIGEGVNYKVKVTDRVSSVTSAIDSTVEKSIVTGEGFTVGAKKTTVTNN